MSQAKYDRNTSVKPSKWAMLGLAYQRGHSAGACCIMYWLLDHLNIDTLQCNPGINRLMELSGLSRRSVFNSISELKADNLISVSSSRTDTSAYSFNFDLLAVSGAKNCTRVVQKSSKGGADICAELVQETAPKLTTELNSELSEGATRKREERTVAIRLDSPEWRAWEQYNKSRDFKGPYGQVERGSIWYAPSQWPPDYKPNGSAQ